MFFGLFLIDPAFDVCDRDFDSIQGRRMVSDDALAAVGLVSCQGSASERK